MIVKLLTELHLKFLSLKGGCRGSSLSTHVKMPHCWKSHALAKILFYMYTYTRELEHSKPYIDIQYLSIIQNSVMFLDIKILDRYLKTVFD